jgi:hypothetical protein
MPAGRATPGRRRLASIGFALVALLRACDSARSEVRQHPTGGVDTEHMFGFTEGSDIGDKGDSELLSETTGHFGKLGGAYGQIASTLEAKRTLADNFRVSASATGAYFDMSGVAGVPDRRDGTFQALSFSTRYRVLNRVSAPFGLTFSAEPHWGFVDDMSGASAGQIGAEFLALIDRELLPGRLFGAFNVSYEPERTRLHAGGAAIRDSTLGLGAALAVQVLAGVSVGAEARYLRRFDGLAFEGVLGQALYVGPTIYAAFNKAMLNKDVFVSATWNAQIWGAAGGHPGPFDLVNFDRHGVKVRAGLNF